MGQDTSIGHPISTYIYIYIYIYWMLIEIRSNAVLIYIYIYQNCIGSNLYEHPIYIYIYIYVCGDWVPNRGILAHIQNSRMNLCLQFLFIKLSVTSNYGKAAMANLLGLRMWVILYIFVSTAIILVVHIRFPLPPSILPSSQFAKSN